MEIAENAAMAIAEAVNATADKALYIGDAELTNFLKSAENRRELIRLNFVVRRGRTDAELLVHSKSVGSETLAKFIAAHKATPAWVREAKSAKSVSAPAGEHKYHPPAIAQDIARVLRDDVRSHVIWIYGPSQAGKDKMVHYLAENILNRKLFQVNCLGDMSGDVLFGSKTVDIDTATGQNFVRFKRGTIERAMTEGLEKDADGNAVLDENGAPRVIGEPGILFIDEIAAMPEHVAIGLNRLLESDDKVRSFVIEEDGGRLVKSHPGFRIVLAANTVGRGSTETTSNLYTAQSNPLDISLMNRVGAVFHMGYDRKAEAAFLTEMMGDAEETGKLLSFRDGVRSARANGKIESPLSTGQLVNIAHMWRIFNNDLRKALYLAAFNTLLPEEKPVWDEIAVPIFGASISDVEQGGDIDY